MMIIYTFKAKRCIHNPSLFRILRTVLKASLNKTSIHPKPDFRYFTKHDFRSVGMDIISLQLSNTFQRQCLMTPQILQQEPAISNLQFIIMR